MGRRRTQDKHLPQRVYLEHGAYYFRPRGGSRQHLGRELPNALARYAVLIGDAWNSRTLGDVIDRYRTQVLPLKRSAKTRADQSKQLDRLKKAFGHAADNVTAQHYYAYQDARRSADGKPVPVAARHEVVLLGHVFGKAIHGELRPRIRRRNCSSGGAARNDAGFRWSGWRQYARLPTNGCGWRLTWLLARGSAGVIC